MEINKRPLFNEFGDIETNKKKMINGNTTNLNDFNNMKYTWVSEWYRQAMNNFWIPEEINLAQDLKDYKKLTKEEKTAYDKILSFLIFLDSIQTANLGNINSYITASEVNLCLTIQAFQEAVHSQSYSYMLDSICSPEERNEILFQWKDDAILLQRNKFIGDLYNNFLEDSSMENFIKSVMANYILEGVYFYSGFMFFYNLERNGKMPGSAQEIRYINRDENTHLWLFRSIIKELKEEIESRGLTLKVIESVNVHDAIKIGLPSREQYIENYKQTIRNLAEYGIEVICYNFMPVFDWVKSDLDYRLEDGSSTLAFISADIPADPKEIVERIEQSNNEFELPGWEPERLAHIKSLLEAYASVDEEKLRENFAYFLQSIIPTCEEVGVKMAVHPDDPPYSIFGLPRIVKNREDLDWLCRVVDSPSNGITLCTGSIAEDPENDVYEILAEFCQRDRIPFAHVRNIKFLDNRDFYEAPHKSEYGSLDMYRILKTMYDNGFDGYIRPDHGRMIWNETGRPGYGLYDRALGAVYLNGLWEAIEKGNERKENQ